MKLSRDQQQDLNDRSWDWALRTGREERGNLEINLQFLEQTGLLRDGMKAIELGCGAASLADALYRKGVDITACDVSEVAISRAGEKYPHLKLSVQNAEQLPWPEEHFDVVLSFDVFEHLFEPDRHLSEVRRILKPNGCYLFQTPNRLTNMIYETVKTHSWTTWRQYHPSLHYAGQLKRRLAKHGFESKFIKMNTVNAFTLQKLESCPRLRKCFSRLNFQCLPLWMQTNFYVIARKMK